MPEEPDAFFQKVIQTGSWGKVYSASQDSRWSSYPRAEGIINKYLSY